MEHLEMVEKLVEKTGVTYQEARDVLEKTDWNLLDALIALERKAAPSTPAAATVRRAHGRKQREPSGRMRPMHRPSAI